MPSVVERYEGWRVNDLPSGLFGCILADPPWAFKTYNNEKGTTPHRGDADHYSVMSASDLRDLPVVSSAAKDCALFMWVVDSHLDAALDLGRAWGFEFKTIAFVWVKTMANPNEMCLFEPEPRYRIGMGYWTRKQSELCLLFTRGKPKRLDKGVRQIIAERKREHSRKPDEQYARIEALVDGPRLELFARNERPGWTAWGNQTGKFGA